MWNQDQYCPLIGFITHVIHGINNSRPFNNYETRY